MAESSTSVKPARAIYTDEDLEKFKDSEPYKELVHFVRVCGEAVEGKKISDATESSTVLVVIDNFLADLKLWIDEIPPIQQPMRFGNKAFRTFHERLTERAPEFVQSILDIGEEDLSVYNEELKCYVCDSFGNEHRIDYGTGHETNFAIFALCLFKLGLLTNNDLSNFVLRTFPNYIQVMRKLQSVYVLEPAGSHGVWGLDDYHCLIFVWGASQLMNHPDITPQDIHDTMLVRSNSSEYMYLEGIQSILEVKHTAPFHETSPMLHSISELGDWRTVKNGMHKLYKGEVLNKRPVVQHTIFGHLFKCTWTPSVLLSPVEGGPGVHVPTNRGNASIRQAPNLPPPMEATRAPWAKQD